MKKIVINGIDGDSNVYIGEKISNLHKYLKDKDAIIITDSNVKAHYEKYFSQYRTIEIGTGEGIKNLVNYRFTTYHTTKTVCVMILIVNLSHYVVVATPKQQMVTEPTGRITS